MHARKYLALVITLALAVTAAAACSGDAGAAGQGTLTPIADSDMKDAFEAAVSLPNGGSMVSAVTAEQVAAGDATAWAYLLEEDMRANVVLRIYEHGTASDPVTVLPGASGINGTILFGASPVDSGWIWATDLRDSGGLQSHRYTSKVSSTSEPRRLAASTVSVVPDSEIWLAALLYDLESGYAPADIAELQEDGLDQVPFAAVLSVTFHAATASI